MRRPMNPLARGTGPVVAAVLTVGLLAALAGCAGELRTAAPLDEPSVPTARIAVAPAQGIASAPPEATPQFVDAFATAQAEGVLLAWWAPDGSGETLRLPHPVAIEGYTGQCSGYPGMFQVALAGGGQVWLVASHVGASEADVAAQREQCRVE